MSESLLDLFQKQLLERIETQKKDREFISGKLKSGLLDCDVKISYYKRRTYPRKPMNEPFINSHVHHLHINRLGQTDHSLCIFVPREMHMDNYHNSITWEGMDKMNNLAWKFYEEQKKDIIYKKFGVKTIKEKKRLENEERTRNIKAIYSSMSSDKLRGLLNLVKKCPHCEEEKVFSEFCVDRASNTGCQSWCRKCKNEYDAEFRRVRKERIAIQNNEIAIQNYDKGIENVLVIDNNLREAILVLVERLKCLL